MNYAIAYLDKTGIGFSNIEPFIYDDCESLEEAIKQKENMINNGFKNVIVFSYTKELLEIIDWDFIKSHKILE